VLIDAACYFGALRKALYPEVFIDLLSALVNERPQLRVYLLVWDYSVLFALERELRPSIWLRWRMPHRIRYCLDDDLPAGAGASPEDRRGG